VVVLLDLVLERLEQLIRAELEVMEVLTEQLMEALVVVVVHPLLVATHLQQTIQPSVEMVETDSLLQLLVHLSLGVVVVVVLLLVA
jgi:uncharacterized radical SAM superfamily protein